MWDQNIFLTRHEKYKINSDRKIIKSQGNFFLYRVQAP